jgi:hypothetical protein
MKFKFLLALGLGWVPVAAVAATEVATAPTPPAAAASTASGAFTRELGRGLGYQRVLTLPGDLPATDARKRPLVLDLRYGHGDANAAAALAAWLKSYATPRSPVFVLANAETDRAILGGLAGRSTAGSILVIGVPARDFVPDIPVQSSPAMERSAYDALAAGTDPTQLIVENSDKIRNDEASLARDHSTEPGAETAKDRPPAPPLDAALQRAVHLYRTLIALRKI